MKTIGFKTKHLFPLLTMALMALSPALCLANSRDCGTSGKSHVLKLKALDLHTLEALRTGRLTSTSHWRTVSKKNPEDSSLSQKVFRVKTRWSQGKLLNPVFSAGSHSPRNFLVLRI